MRQRRAVLTLATTWLCLGFSIPAAADQPANTSRAAWEWTDAERLNERRRSAFVNSEPSVVGRWRKRRPESNLETSSTEDLIQSFSCP